MKLAALSAVPKDGAPLLNGLSAAIRCADRVIEQCAERRRSELGDDIGKARDAEQIPISWLSGRNSTSRTRQTQQAGAHRIATQRRAIRSRAHRSRLAALPRHSARRPASPIGNASVSSVDLVGQAVQLGRPSRTAKAVACSRRRTSAAPAAGAPAPATRTTVRATRRWTVS